MKKFLSIALLGGALMLSGCGSDRDEFVWIDGGPTLAAPIAVADAYTVNANTTLTVPVAGSVLLNDTVNGATLAFPATTTNGGTITGLADGSFTYTPALDFFGTDTFTYTLANSGGSSTTTVTITVAGFVVDAATGNDTTGSFATGSPFATVQGAVTVAGTGADIVVRQGSYSGTVTLKNGQRLLGTSAAKPTLTGPVIMGDGCTLDSLKIENTPATVGAGDSLGDAVIGDGRTGGTVTKCEISNSADEAVSGIGISGAWFVNNNTFSNPGGFGAEFEVSGTDVTVLRFDENSVDGARGALGFLSGGNAALTASVKNNVFTNSAGVGSALELTCGGASTFSLDIESNNNDDQYMFFIPPASTATLNVEQLLNLNGSRPSGAGNIGGFDDGTSIGGLAPTPVADGFCGFTP